MRNDAMDYAETLRTYQSLEAGDQVEVTHTVKVGFRQWPSTTVGSVVRKSRERHSLHYRRGADDYVYRDTLVLCREDGELTTLTLDEFSTLQVRSRAHEAPRS